MSQILKPSALKALTRIGNLIIPRNGEFPAFSEVGGLEYIDDIAAYAPEDDMKDLNMVLSILGYMPDFVLKWVIKKMETARENNGPLGTIFRQMDYGLRGLIFSCYYTDKVGADYSGKNPIQIIGGETTRVEG